MPPIFAWLFVFAAAAEAFHAPMCRRVDSCRARASPPAAAIWDRLPWRRPVPATVPDVPRAGAGEPEVAVATPAATQTTTLRAVPGLPAVGAGEADGAPATGVARATGLLADTDPYNGVARTTTLLADTDAYNAKIAQAEAENRVVVIKFYASWCRACKALAPKFAKVAQDWPELEFCEMLFDDNKKLCKQLGIKVLPYVEIVSGSAGKVDGFSCGPSKISTLIERLEVHGGCQDEIPCTSVADQLDGDL